MSVCCKRVGDYVSVFTSRVDRPHCVVAYEVRVSAVLVRVVFRSWFVGHIVWAGGVSGRVF